MPRVLNELLDEDSVVPKRGQSLFLAESEPVYRLLIVVGNSHSLSASAGTRLDHHWVADLIGNSFDLFWGVDFSEVPWDSVDIGRPSELL